MKRRMVVMTKAQKLVLVISILASGVSFLDSSVVNVALPAIAKSLGGGLSTQQWVIDGYLLTLSALILIAGSLSDNLGRIRILVIGLVSFGVTSLACALAVSPSTLIIARIFQGMAGALLVPSSLALIISTFQEQVAQGEAIGYWTAWTGIAYVIGPLLGGALVQFASWRWIFALNIFPIAITLWLIRDLPLKSTQDRRTPVDWRGSLLCAAGFGAAIYGLISQPRVGWVNPLVYGSLVIGLVLLYAFYVRESRISNPMMPPALFKVRNFLFGNLATIAIYAGLSATFIITVYVQQVAGYTPLGAGLALLPVTVIMFFLSPRFGTLAGRYGARLFMTLGPAIAAVGFLMMGRVDARAPYITQLFPAVLLFGLGLSLTVAPLTGAVLGSIDAQHAGVGSAINNAIARIAGLLAVAGIGIAIGQKLDVSGFHRGSSAIAILLFLGSLISYLGIRTVPAKTMEKH